MTPKPRATGAVLIVALSGLLMGFDGSLFTGAVIFIERVFALSRLEFALAVTSHTLAATVSIFVAGPLADRFGRRTVLQGAGLAFALSAAVAAIAPTFPALIVARLLSGLGVGAVLVAAPMYIAEISPPAVRGRMVTFSQLFIVLGIFLAFTSNYAIVRLGTLGSDWLVRFDLAHSSWRWMLGIGVVPAAIYLFALLFVPESPRWHAMHGRLEAARRVLTRAHGAVVAQNELAEVRASLAHDSGSRDARLGDLWAPRLRSVLVIGLVVAVVQQITGINSVMAYATVIFERAADAGTGDPMPFMRTMLLGLVNLLATVVALMLIDRVGRRPLFLFGTGGMAVFLLITAWGFGASDAAMNPTLVLVGLLGFVGCFALSLGPGLWVLLSEIFPNRVRGVAISFVGVVNSSVCLLVQFVFPWEMDAIGGARTFLIYALFAIAGVLLLGKLLPETRGRSLEQLEELLARRT
jgi:SP family arabinose:H+ symporter-like MFS transporter